MGLKNSVPMQQQLVLDGLILPDLPEYEYETEYGAIIKTWIGFPSSVTPGNQ